MHLYPDERAMAMAKVVMDGLYSVDGFLKYMSL